MANVLFKKMNRATYDALATKDMGTLYRVTETDNSESFYQGSNKLDRNDLDVSEFALASVSNGVVTIKGIKEVDGAISVGVDTTKDVVLAKVATTGTAADVAVADLSGNFDGENVEAVLAEIADALGEGVDGKTVYVVQTPGTASDTFSKRYTLYQGSEGSSASPVAGEKLVDIDLPKDMVVSDGVCRKATAQDVTDAGANPGFAVGDYIVVLTIANNDGTKIFIPVQSLIDIYTAEQNATQIQLAIDSNNVISATIVAGSVGTTELADGAVTTAKLDADAVTGAKIADDAVGAEHISIAAHTESADQTGRTDGLSVSVTTTDGQVSGVVASIAAETYEEYGAVTAAVEALDTVSDVVVASKTGDVVTIAAGIAEEDGIIKAGAGSAITLEEVASTGAAADVSIADAGGFTAQTTVEGALQEVYEKLTWEEVTA